MRIFLSSTIEDLKSHRAAALEAIAAASHQAVTMENFHARPEAALLTVRKEIDACDLFIGVYAHRYGFVPPAATKSITELEFEHARGAGKPVLAFIVDDSLPWPPRMVETGSARLQLDAFLDVLRKSLVCATFREPATLHDAILQSLAQFPGGALAPVPPDYDSDQEEDAFASWTAFRSLRRARQIEDSRDESTGRPLVTLESFGGEFVGLNKSTRSLAARVEFRYLIAPSEHPLRNVRFFAIPMRESVLGREGLMEVGGDRPDSLENGFSIHRASHDPPLAHYRDGAWHAAALAFDFRRLPAAFYTIVAPRLNEGCVETGAGRVSIGGVRIFAQD